MLRVCRGALLRRLWPRLCSGAGALILWSAAVGGTSTHGVLLAGAARDFGRQAGRPRLRHSFRMWNSTVLPVGYSAMGGCGCTDLDNAEGVIPPLGWRTVTVTIDTTRDAGGRAERGVQVVFTAGPKRWQQEVSIRYALPG